MSLLHDSIQNKKFDTRMLEKNLTRGAATDKEYKSYIESLPDDSENADYASLDDLEAQKK